MFRRLLVPVAACVLLGACATRARAQVRGGTSDADRMMILTYLDLIELAGFTFEDYRESYYGYLNDAWYALNPWNAWAFDNAVAGMQLMEGQYGTWLTYSLEYFIKPLLQLDPSYLQAALDYIDYHIGQVEAMIEAAKRLRAQFPNDPISWGMLTTHIGNMESLVNNLKDWRAGFVKTYGNQ